VIVDSMSLKVEAPTLGAAHNQFCKPIVLVVNLLLHVHWIVVVVVMVQIQLVQPAFSVPMDRAARVRVVGVVELDAVDFLVERVLAAQIVF